MLLNTLHLIIRHHRMHGLQEKSLAITVFQVLCVQIVPLVNISIENWKCNISSFHFCCCCLHLLHFSVGFETANFEP